MKLFDLLYKLNSFDLCKKEFFSEEENIKFRSMKQDQLPEDVIRSSQSNEYYKISKPDLSDEELKLYVLLLQAEFLRTIRNCIVFFAFLTAMGLFFWILTLISR